MEHILDFFFTPFFVMYKESFHILCLSSVDYSILLQNHARIHRPYILQWPRQKFELSGSKMLVGTNFV